MGYWLLVMSYLVFKSDAVFFIALMPASTPHFWDGTCSARHAEYSEAGGTQEIKCTRRCAPDDLYQQKTVGKN